MCVYARVCETLFIFSEGSCYKNNLPGNLISEREKEPFVSEEVALTAALGLPQPSRRGRAHGGLGASHRQLGLEALKEAWVRCANERGKLR